LADLHPASFAWALACCHRNQSDAEDVLQMSYLKILDGRARFSGQSSFKTWLFGVIRFTALEHRRRIWFRWLRTAPLDNAATAPAADPGPEARAFAGERAAQVHAALGQLSARQREVLMLVFHHSFTLDDAAEAMGVSPGSARTHYERGKQRLRGLLDPSLLAS
jgi:RNA polymerase sigma-70 factor (ECF subfamily)